MLRMVRWGRLHGHLDFDSLHFGFLQLLRQASASKSLEQVWKASLETSVEAERSQPMGQPGALSVDCCGRYKTS